METSDIKELLESMMERLVPGEPYSITVEDVGGQFKFECQSDSKRALVAWAEISYHLEECVEKDLAQNIGF